MLFGPIIYKIWTHNAVVFSYSLMGVYVVALGSKFIQKLIILIIVVVLSVVFYRPFCKWICPLGAFYALMNKVSLLGIKVDEHKCVSCGKCARACKMDVDVVKTPNSTECIRCGKCITACPTDALSFHYGFGMPEKNLCNTVKENNKTDIKTKTDEKINQILEIHIKL